MVWGQLGERNLGLPQKSWLTSKNIETMCVFVHVGMCVHVCVHVCEEYPFGMAKVLLR